MAEMPIIDQEKCNGCGLCVSVCSCQALVLVDNVVTFIKQKECRQCTRWCNLCEAVCPTGAISCPFEIVFEDQ